MKLNRVVPMLWVENIEQTVVFYRDVLGFDCPGQLESWACLVNHEVELMISLPNQHEPFEKLGFTESPYSQPDDVDLLWDDLKDKLSLSIPLRISLMACANLPSATTYGYIMQFGKPTE